MNEVKQIVKKQRGNFKIKSFDTVFNINDNVIQAEKLEKICKQVEYEVKKSKCNLIILSNEKSQELL